MKIDNFSFPDDKKIFWLVHVLFSYNHTTHFLMNNLSLENL